MHVCKRLAMCVFNIFVAYVIHILSCFHFLYLKDIIMYVKELTLSIQILIQRVF